MSMRNHMNTDVLYERVTSFSGVFSIKQVMSLGLARSVIS